MNSLHDASVVSYEDLRSNSVIEKFNNKKIVLVGGCFDILHLGHVTFLANARENGEFLIVALESDKFIEETKKREPFHNQQQRAIVLASIRYVDLVVKLPYFEKINRDARYANLVDLIKPSVIAVTESDAAYEKKKKHAERVCGKIITVTRNLESLSSSAILKYGNLLGD